MQSVPLKRLDSDALAASGRVLALAVCLAITGCQTTTGQHDVDAPRKPSPFARGLQQEPVWLTDTPSPVTHEDIWERLREGFKLQDLTDANPRIEQQRLLFANNTRSVEQATERGAPYIHYIVERLEERDMPLELALLPVIESSYNPLAYSRAHAVGLWQFIPSTGLHYNLRQTNWYDGRRDITASTNAALSYLTRLHGMFNGDWLLALAAYNAGEGTVSRAIERNQKLGLPTDYWNLALPQETRNYVPKLLALSQMVMSPQAYGIALSPIANEPYFAAIPVKQRMNLAQLASMADLDEDELFQLNPAYKQRITLDGPQQLLVPAEKAEMLAASLALMKPSDVVLWQQYQVRRGDTLSAIATRHQLTVSTLREINHLTDDRLSIGQSLSIPGSTTPEPASPLGQAVAKSNASAPRSYRVRQGDNLWGIAKAQNVSVQDLQRWNRLSGSNLRVGQALFLQGPAVKLAAAKPRASQDSSPTYYKVQRGDSLYMIAKRFNVQLQSLQSWNPSSSVLKPGQTLTLYLP
ncbi:LysM peptidoglycan-binding domain-containing protein [Stutzerimonas azotifigens]|uniref:LysM peptidoglycan-binding domain-containing protein n=1 Tax=Stutzerimonas azotifigens TaxID=291995 RepID=A0ABR5Z4A8_9GAMM|nr:LysM peptidoglycan-binding domain-containing protein [Stutzerimonas azotifigens]MBA1275060.1 LysM peptidoglycan-binding domain-containing protein [Stutzerimonas azotifigens]